MQASTVEKIPFKSRSLIVKPLILVVEDHAGNAQLLLKILQNDKYNVVIANNGEEALQEVEKNKPDLILLDIIMPGMDGFEVCRRLQAKEETKEIPIICLSSKSDSPDIINGFKLGARDYVTKPYNKIELLARVKTHVELKRSKENLSRSYNELKDSQDKILELERKNTVLAMIVTTNHEFNQPLTALSCNLQLFSESSGENNLSESQKKYINNMHRAMRSMQTILTKYRNSMSFHFKKYDNKSNMVVFEETVNKT